MDVQQKSQQTGNEDSACNQRKVDSSRKLSLCNDISAEGDCLGKIQSTVGRDNAAVTDLSAMGILKFVGLMYLDVNGSVLFVGFKELIVDVRLVAFHEYAYAFIVQSFN